MSKLCSTSAPVFFNTLTHPRRTRTRGWRPVRPPWAPSDPPAQALSVLGESDSHAPGARTRMRPARARTPHTCAAPRDPVCATWGGRARGRVACLGVVGCREGRAAPERSRVRKSQRACVGRPPPRGLRGIHTGTGVGTSRPRGTRSNMPRTFHIWHVMHLPYLVTPAFGPRRYL